MSSTSTGTKSAPASHDIDPAQLEPNKREEIAKLAYAYWEARGCPLGSPEEDWLQAERELGLGQTIPTPPTARRAEN